jgi:hypothetical protein
MTAFVHHTDTEYPYNQLPGIYMRAYAYHQGYLRAVRDAEANVGNPGFSPQGNPMFDISDHHSRFADWLDWIVRESFDAGERTWNAHEHLWGEWIVQGCPESPVVTAEKARIAAANFGPTH